MPTPRQKDNSENNNQDPKEPLFFLKHISSPRIGKIVRGITKRKLAQKNLGDDLTNIYQDRFGNLPDMSRLERKKRSKLKVFLVSSIFFLLMLAVVAWAGFFIFNQGPTGFSGKGVGLQISSAETIASGEEVTYLLKYANRENVLLKNVKLYLRYPSGFIFKEANPYPLDENNNSWNLGALLRGREGQIEIKGQLVGEVDTTKTLSAVLSFEPAGFNSEFQEVASFNTKIISSIIDLYIQGEEKVLPGQVFSYKIKYKNTSQDLLKDLQVSAFWGEDFILEESSPRAFHRDNVWLMEKLASLSEQEILIRGKFLPETIGERELKVRVGVAASPGQYQLQQEKVFKTLIVNEALSVNLIINGSTENKPINFGQTLNYTIVYKNNGQSSLGDLEISAVLDASILDWFSLKDKARGVIKENLITWTKSEIPRLGNLGPGEEGIIDFEINIIANPEETETLDFKVISLVKARVGQVADLATDFEVTSNTVVNEVNSGVALRQEGRFYDEAGLIIGQGPLPPQVDKTTTYKIFWFLDNGIHEIQEVAVITSLPKGVAWAGDFKVSAGEISYNQSSAQVAWEINRVPQNVGGLAASFSISITPQEDDVGKVLILTNETRLKAYDKVTAGEIVVSLPIITTDLKDDIYAQGKGVVQGEES